MNQLLNLLNFKSSKDRDDFIIAVLVLLFFAWLMWWLFPSFANSSNMPPEQPNIAITPIVSSQDEAKEVETPKEAIIILDSDKDGILDKDDACPNHKGTLALKGCPSDKDNDGVFDMEDKCPDMAGLSTNNGCPEATVNDDERKILESAVQGIEFKTGSADLVRTSRSILYRIARIMKDYPEYKLEIIGHTDNTGDSVANLELSKNRAQTCYDYLVNNEIDPERMTYKGYGQKKPIDSNETKEGQAKNRRVEFNLSY